MSPEAARESPGGTLSLESRAVELNLHSCYPALIMKNETRNRMIIGVVFVLAAGVIGYRMFFSMTPPRHADHDHAIAKLDAGGFLWLDVFGGGRRNMVGRPGTVLLMHWFDPTAATFTEQQQAVRFAAGIADDPMVDVLFVAQAPSWEGLESWAERSGMPTDQLYLDKGHKTGKLFGVLRQSETLIYDPSGKLAYQAMGPADWSGSTLLRRIEAAKAGVDEIH